MKKVFRYSLAFTFLAITGCSKYLEKEPDNRAKLDSPEKVSQFLGTAYPQANYQAFAETMSDNVTDIGTGSNDNTIRDAYVYEDSPEDQEDSPEFYWYACYAAIAVTNQALETISQATNPNDYSAQKGEALVARAYAHFMLVTFFSNAYDVATAGTDPGIPYVTEPEKVVIKQYDRKTVQYVYEMIEKDLLEGLPLIDDRVYNVPKFHFNRAAANAFAARFYLFKKDYPKVVQYANLAVPGNNFLPNLRPWNTAYQTITDVTELFKIYPSSTENANLLLVETASLWARNYYSDRYGVDNTKQSQILPRPDKVTGGIFAYSQYCVIECTHQLIPKIDEYFVRVSVNASIGNAYVMVPLFTVEEVLFNRAEAFAYMNNPNAAIADLNTFASTRIDNYDANTHNITATKINDAFSTTNIQTGLINAILYYKRAEFIHEGMRWFDILRYKLPVVHQRKNGSPITLTASDPRKALQLPKTTIQAGLSPNSR